MRETKREACAQRTQADDSRRERQLDVKLLRVSRKPDANFSFDSESSQNTFSERDGGNEPGDQFESGVHSAFRFADPSSVGGFLLEGNKDHLLNQARSELMKQEHKVGSINSCINELQQQAYAQRLELATFYLGQILYLGQVLLRPSST